MSDHLSTEGLHDLLDGLLAPEKEAAARAHLEACTSCRREHLALARLLREVGDLPDQARVPDDLWAGIEGRIARRPGGMRVRSAAEENDAPHEATVLTLPATRPTRRRFALTLPQLAAAAIVVALMSAGGMWAALSRSAPSASPSLAGTAFDDGFGSAARMAASGDVAYDRALLQLQTLVDRGRDVLAPETVETLDRSLRTIDDAIAQIREALAKDPSSELLNRMLIDQQKTKLRVLRQAALSMQARS